MKVSIVIPALNEEGYIENAVRSALEQDYPDFEVIVVDNGSTDRTRDIVKKYPAVKLVEEPVRGLPAARERGRIIAKGDIIAQMDADCIAPKDWVSKGVKYFIDPKVVGVSGPYYFYDASGAFKAIVMPTQIYGLSLVSSVLDKTIGSTAMIGGNAFIRSSALEKIGGYDTSIGFHGEDTDTANRLAKVGRLLFRNDIMTNSSARRFKNVGIGTTLWRYGLNFVWVGLFKRPFHREAEYYRDR